MRNFFNNVFLKRNSLIYLGLFIGIYYLLMTIGMRTFLGSYIFFGIVLSGGIVIGFLLSILLSLGSFYYYSHKSNDLTILILAIISIIVVLFGLFGLQFIFSIFGNLKYGNFLMALSNFDGMIKSMKLYDWAFYFAYLTSFYSLVLCLDMHRIVVIPIITNHCSKIYCSQANPINEQIINSPILPQQHAKNKKNKTRFLVVLGIIISLVCVGTGGYFVYKTFFKKVSINLVESVELMYVGDDGKGYASVVARNNYSGNDKNIENFLAVVDYQIEESFDVINGQLSNGQKVTVVAKYSQSDAKKYNIEITNDKSEVEVSGLIKVYQKGSEIPQEVLEKFKNGADEKAQSFLTSNTFEKRTVELDSMYFATTKIGGVKMIAVYKHTTQSLLDKNKASEVKYISYYLDNPKSNYSQKDYWFSRTLFNSEYKTITKKEELKPAILSNYNTEASSLEELKVSTKTTSSSDEYI